MLDKPSPVTPDFLIQLKEIVGDPNVLTEASDQLPFLTEQRDKWTGLTPAVVRPGSTTEVAAVVTACAAANVAIVPQGGGTGLVGGQIPDRSNTQLVISLGRLNRIRVLDTANATITVEAGVTLQNLHCHAEEAGLLFPLTIGSKGSCQIGGNLSTNAGGTAVLRYGNSRDLCLGLEVVLPDGRVWDGLRSLRKDNTGYDLKHLFVGGEGTLGIITAAVMKLYPLPRSVEATFIAVPSPGAAIELLGVAKSSTGDQVTGFELMPRIGLEMVTANGENMRDPMPDAPSPWYVLMEISGGGEPAQMRESLETALGKGMECGLISDAAIARNESQRTAFWSMREYLSEAQKFEGGSIKHDISVPVSRMAEFIARADVAVARAIPGIRPVAFGHIGDGNVHYNLTQPVGAGREAYLARWQEIADIVHGLANGMNGSISAEHGLGQLKNTEVLQYKSELEMELMHRVKAALDPQGIMNPGKLLS